MLYGGGARVLTLIRGRVHVGINFMIDKVGGRGRGGRQVQGQAWQHRQGQVRAQHRRGRAQQRQQAAGGGRAQHTGSSSTAGTQEGYIKIKEICCSRIVLLCCSGIVRIGNEDLVPHYICTSVPGTRGRQHVAFY